MANDPFYWSKEWRAARLTHLQSRPYCDVCAAIGIETRATEVDHHKSIRKGGSPFHPSNLRSKCKMHHSQKTGLIDGVKAKQKKYVVTGPDGWPLPDMSYYGDRKKD